MVNISVIPHTPPIAYFHLKRYANSVPGTIPPHLVRLLCLRGEYFRKFGDWHSCVSEKNLTRRRGGAEDAEKIFGESLKIVYISLRDKNMIIHENEIGDIIIDTAVNLHMNLGSGLLESVYEVILTKLLVKKGLSVQRQVSIPIETVLYES